MSKLPAYKMAARSYNLLEPTEKKIPGIMGREQSDLEVPETEGLGEFAGSGNELSSNKELAVAFDLLETMANELPIPKNIQSIKAWSSNPDEIAMESGIPTILLDKINRERGIDIFDLKLNDKVYTKTPPVRYAQYAGGTMTDADPSEVPYDVRQEAKENPAIVTRMTPPTKTPERTLKGLGVRNVEKAEKEEEAEVIVDDATLLSQITGVGKGRLKKERGVEISDYMIDGISDYIAMIETKDRNIPNRNKNISASGYFQMTNDATRTAANRTIKALSRNDFKIPTWLKEVQKGNTSIMDLSRDRQKMLMLGDLFEQDKSDEYWERIANGESQAVKDMWTELWHTTKNVDDDVLASAKTNMDQYDDMLERLFRKD